MSSLKILVSTGEVSGQLHANHLIEALHAQSKNPISVLKMEGNPRLSTVGFLEPVLHLPKILKRFYQIKAILEQEKPDLVIAIDYQGFNLPLLKAAKKLGIRTVYYISPQEWQWGTDAGGKAVLAATDLLLAIFKEEADFYTRLGGNVRFVGHPLLATTKFTQNTPFPPNTPIVAVFAGSRLQEIKRVFPKLLQTALNCQKIRPNSRIYVSVSSDVFTEDIKKLIPTEAKHNITLYSGSSYDLMNAAELCFAPSGTITLELAILGKPAIIGYSFNPLSLWIAKKLYGERLKRIIYISLPNLLFKKHVLPEFFQDAFTVANMTKKALSLLTHKDEYTALSQELKTITQHLGSTPDAPQKAAEEILNFLKTPLN